MLITKTEKQVCLDYLKALAAIKHLSYYNETHSYHCFGIYNYQICRNVDTLPCQICMAQVTRPSADWIQEMCKDIQKGE